jgi:hypothetical protein
MIAAMPSWVPMSWLYVGFGVVGFWRRLNLGDRVFLIGVVIVGFAIAIGLGAKLSSVLATSYPDWMPIGIAVFAAGLVILALNVPMVAVRSHRFNHFAPETTSRRTVRIGLEFGLSATASVAVAFILVWSTPAPQGGSVFSATMSFALGVQLVWHITQLIAGLLPNARTGRGNSAAADYRSRLSALALTNGVVEILPATSSRFLLKAITNPFVWIVIILTTLVAGGAIVAAPTPFLWTVSGLSTLLLIAQFALMEPRVGNGVVLGAHSVDPPIKRGFNDLSALMLPHFMMLSVAGCVSALTQSWMGLYVAIGQGLVTAWGLWLSLVVKALPPRETTKHALWAVIGGMIAGQVFPPLIVILAIAITVAITRDLRALTQKGPALWPRP